MGKKKHRLVPGTQITCPSVELHEGNAFFIIGQVRKALRRAGCPESVVDAFVTEAKSGDYDAVLQTAMKYADV